MSKVCSPENWTREWFERVWNRGEERAVQELMSGKAEILGLGTSVTNPEGFVRIHRAFRGAFQQILVEVADIVCDEMAVAGHARFTAMHRASGCEVDVLFSFAGRFEEGQVIWLRHVFDFTALLSQIGTLDPRAVNLLFTN